MKNLVIRAAIAAVIFVSCNQAAVQTTPPGKPLSQDSLIQRGRYLVAVIGCGDCHSPKKFGPMGPQEDTSLLLSGHPASLKLPAIDTSILKSWILFTGMQTATAGPWGVSFSANLTSDSTGIGAWTESQFVKALREGKSKGLDNNRMLLPPMPWTDYRNMTDEDVSAIFAYLKSTKPVRNVVPQPQPPTYNKKG